MRSLKLVVVFGLALFAGGVSPTWCHAQSKQSASLPPLDPANKWTKEIQAFEDADRATPPPRAPIVFTGSSSIRRWTELTADYPKHRVLNRGFGGSQLSDIRDHFERLILRYQPRQVVIYSGGNDIHAGKSVERVVEDMRAIRERIHRELPTAKILYVSIALNPSRWAERDRVIAANQQIAEMLSHDPRDKFADVTQAMLGSDGQPKPDIFVEDRLHMNRKGYEVWIPILKPLLAEP